MNLAEATEQLLQTLEWSEGFWLGWVFCEHRGTREALRASFLAWHTQHGKEVLQIQADEEDAISSLLLQPSVAGAWIAFPADTPQSVERWRHFHVMLNERRERMRRLSHGAILLVGPAQTPTEDLKALTRNCAPDLWSIRGLVLEVDDERAPLLPTSLLTPSAAPTGDIPFLRRMVDQAQREHRPAAESRGRRQLALLLAAQGFPKEAEQEAQTALAVADTELRQMEARWTLGTVRADRKAGCENLGEVVSWYRHKAVADPALLLPLGQALNDLGTTLIDAEEVGEAAKALEESVVTLELVQATRPDAAEEILAIALLNLGVAQTRTGRALRALKATERAVALLRKQKSPWLFLALINLNIRLATLGRHREALAVLSDAQQVLEARPKQLRSDEFVVLAIRFGITLFNLGELQAAQDSFGAAITILTSTAVPLRADIRRDLEALYHALSPSLPASLAESAAALLGSSQ